MLMRTIFAVLVLLMASESFAQLSRKEKKAAKQSSQGSQPTTLDPGTSENSTRTTTKKARKKESNGPTYNSQKEFADRMDARAKTYRKNEKYLMTPQYSNPTYFGHKRPPKKRPANKMKFCKECGIRH